MLSGTKSLCGHSDVLLGAVSVAEPARAEALRRWRTQSGAIAGGFEAWLAHRSLATLGMRLERSSANAAAVAGAPASARRRHRARPPVRRARRAPDGVRGPARRLLARVGAERAQRFLGACSLVAEATSFGGVHSTAERRGRWGTDAVDEGFIRFSAGCEDEEDLLADVARRAGRGVNGLGREVGEPARPAVRGPLGNAGSVSARLAGVKGPRVPRP